MLQIKINTKRIIRCWPVLDTEKIVYTENGFKRLYASDEYSDCLTVKLKDCIALIKTHLFIYAISNHDIWSETVMETLKFEREKQGD